MSHSTSGPGDDRGAGRFTQPPNADRAPDDPTRTHRTPRPPLPEEHLPGEPLATPAPGPGRETPTADAGPPHPPGPAGEPGPREASDSAIPAGMEAGDASAVPGEDRSAGESGVPAEEEVGGDSAVPGEGESAGDSGIPAETEVGGDSAVPGEGQSAGDSGIPAETDVGGDGAVHGEGRSAGDSGLPPETGAEEAVSRRGLPGEERMPGEDPVSHDGLGVPASRDLPGPEAYATAPPTPPQWTAAPGANPAPGVTSTPEGTAAVGDTPATVMAPGTPVPSPSGARAPLLSQDEAGGWERRMRELAVGFVDAPQHVVEEADHVLGEIAGRFEEAVERRRRTLRRSWEASEDRGPGSDTDTEQLRLALRDYRELAGRLLHM